MTSRTRSQPGRNGKQVGLVLPPDLLEPVAALAASRRISRNLLIVQLLVKELDRVEKARLRAEARANPP